MITVSLLDDHPLVLDGVKRMLEDAKDIIMLPFYTCADQLLRYLEVRQPEVLLLDLILPDAAAKNLIPALKERYPAMKILALTSLNQPYYALSLLRSGISGYLLKDCHKDTLQEAIRTVASGARFIDPGLKLDLGGEQEMSDGTLLMLTDREQQMLELIVFEHTNREIARKLHLGIKSIEVIRKDLYLKLGVTNVAGLVRKAIQMGWIT